MIPWIPLFIDAKIMTFPDIIKSGKGNSETIPKGKSETHHFRYSPNLAHLFISIRVAKLQNFSF